MKLVLSGGPKRLPFRIQDRTFTKKQLEIFLHHADPQIKFVKARADYVVYPDAASGPSTSAAKKAHKALPLSKLLQKVTEGDTADQASEFTIIFLFYPEDTEDFHTWTEATRYDTLTVKQRKRFEKVVFTNLKKDLFFLDQEAKVSGRFHVCRHGKMKYLQGTFKAYADLSKSHDDMWADFWAFNFSSDGWDFQKHHRIFANMEWSGILKSVTYDGATHDWPYGQLTD